MAISSDYPRPITVNGYICRNCDDVSDAKKMIDPAAPKGSDAVTALPDSAVRFGGSLDRRPAFAPEAATAARLVNRIA
tara:strand:+ start:1829 stop:2062 length:234 start_codon:yes stop_codon:yes gene_type:complete